MGRASALLTPRVAAFIALAAGLGVYYAVHESLWDASLWWDVAFLAFVLIPAALRARLPRAAALADAAAAAVPGRRRVRRARVRARLRGRRGRVELREARGDDRVRVDVPALLRGRELGRARRRARARGSTPTRSGAGRRITSSRTSSTSSRRSPSPTPSRATRGGEPRAPRPALLRALPGRGCAVQAARVLDVARADGLGRDDDGPHDAVHRQRPPRATAARRSASCFRTPTCSGRRCGGSGRRV